MPDWLDIQDPIYRADHETRKRQLLHGLASEDPVITACARKFIHDFADGANCQQLFFFLNAALNGVDTVVRNFDLKQGIVR